MTSLPTPFDAIEAGLHRFKVITNIIGDFLKVELLFTHFSSRDSQKDRKSFI
jgi:hypothetical protein